MNLHATRGARAALVGAIVAALCLVGAVVAARSAGAPGGQDIQVSVDGQPFTNDPSRGLFDVGGLVPGGSTEAVLGVRAGGAGASEVVLRLIAVHDDENGCTHAERKVDQSCGVGAGELGAALGFTVSAAPGRAGPYQEVWQGNAKEFEQGADTRTTLAPGADRWVRVAIALPGDVGDEVQSDGFRFGLRIEVADGLGTAGVSVGTGSGHAGAGVSGVSLTGAPLDLLLIGAGLLVACGGVLTAPARRRHTRRPNP